MCPSPLFWNRTVAMASHDPETETPPNLTVLSYRAAEDCGPYSDLLGISALTCSLIFAAVAVVVGEPGGDGSVWVVLSPLAPAAIALGIAARRNSACKHSGRKLAAFAIWIGSIETLLMMAAVILPPMHPREPVFRSKCNSNLTQIGQGLAMYANRNQGYLPLTLDLLVSDVDLQVGVFVCPSSDHGAAPGTTDEERLQNFRRDPRHCSFVYLGSGLKLRSLSPDFIVAHDQFANHEKDGVNVLYADGDVEWFSKGQAEYLISQINAGFNPPRPRANPVANTSSKSPASPPPTASSPPP